ncbi:LabA-like NYN domain-containing protein [Achromobacter aloeverae]
MYVDSSNVAMCGGLRMRYDILRALACRGGGEAQRLNTYLAYDEQRAERDVVYRDRSKRFQAVLRDQGFRITVKKVKRYWDDEGVETRKSNADLDMAVDALTESERLDTVLLVTGDGDFVQVVRALQSKGCRVEVLGFDNVSSELRDAADQYINGFLIPGLLPPISPLTPAKGDTKEKPPEWGAIGSRIRGLCNRYEREGYGFIGYWAAPPDTPILAASTSSTAAYFSKASLSDSSVIANLPSWQIVLEFDLCEPSKPDGLPEAKNIAVVSSYPGAPAR